MTTSNNTVSGAQSYFWAFRIWFVGSILLAFYTIMGDTLAGFAAFLLWGLASLFIFPLLHIWYRDKVATYTLEQLLKGPHQ